MRLITLQQVDGDGVTARAGIIPYTHINGETVVLLGSQKNYNSLSDFGGQAEKGETARQCALREMKEELLGPVELAAQIENNLETEDTFVLVGGGEKGSIKRRYIFFVYVDVTGDIIKDFIPNEEVRSIQWYPLAEFTNFTDKEISVSLREVLRFIRRG